LRKTFFLFPHRTIGRQQAWISRNGNPSDLKILGVSPWSCQGLGTV
jgi:hypothetical protein